MKLIEVEIIDFKSIKREKFKLNGNQLCFVGKNECGKSSIIQAVSYLNFLDYELNHKLLNKSSKSYPKGYPIIIGVFEISKETFVKLRELIYAEIPNLSRTIPKDSETSLLQIKRWGNGISNISLILTDRKNYSINITENIEKKAKFWNDFYENIYPNIEYYESEELLLEPATIDQLLSSDKKYETFRRLLYISGCDDLTILDADDDNFISTYLSNLEDNFNEILKKHYKQDESINVRIQTIRGNKLSLVIRDNTKLSFAIDERSPGFKYYFSFLINKLFAKQKNGSKKTILLLDEPGNNLHPQGSKDLLISFNEIAKNSQLLYTTHNPFLTIRNNVDALMFVYKSPKQGTKINQKPFLNKYQIIRKELGILLNDSFLLGDINLVVEGNTEKLAFHRFFQIEKYKKLEWLNIYNAGGVTNISQTINYLGENNLDLAGIAVFDSDKEALNEKKKKGYLKAMKSKKWASVEINDAFSDKKERTFEDLFPQDIYVKAFNDYCNSIKDIGVFDNNYTNFEYTKPIEVPIINTLEEHFFSFINNDRKRQNSITKQDIIRNVLDTIDKMEKEEKGKALMNVYKLLDKIVNEYKKIEKYVAN
ncbi:AAA family ATPase [Candidatus Sulfidibacterium hydrothermale]|uniref:ATP-dependent nuclease n=1 Tax=Candidatus Sulfidibacterium hydrothermale TaxID=2875962 RepID=UPI001F0AEA1D|nr:AAA family ATPase [Candidatus Sulfidibacterium hydrothermale]UBM61306.1 AAA family ATPase [Candidatus Sulfidibacterium hydrothermale]